MTSHPRTTAQLVVVAVLLGFVGIGWLVVELDHRREIRAEQAELEALREQVADILRGEVTVLGISAANRRVDVSGVRVPRQDTSGQQRARSGNTTCWLVSDLIDAHRDSVGRWTIAVYQGNRTRRTDLIGYASSGYCPKARPAD